MTDSKRSNLILIGFMGTGKTTVSCYLAKLLNKKEVDTDQLIVEQEGMSIPDIFKLRGEDYFRSCETKTLIELEKQQGLLISCGGGMALQAENVAHMKQVGTVILLTATAKTIFLRVRNSENRPLLNGNMNIPYIEGLLSQRREKYVAAADRIVATDGKTVAQICQEIAEGIG